MRTKLSMLGISLLLLCTGDPAPSFADTDTVVTVQSGGWQLVGNLSLPTAGGPVPAVLLLNQAGGTRAPYETLSATLLERGIASLRLDLRGHGESTNLGSFLPGEEDSIEFPWDSEADVIAAQEFLKAHEAIDAAKIGVVGASYSGEEMAEAGRQSGYAQAYVALSPGSFSEDSIEAIDTSGIAWLFVIAREDRHLQSHITALQDMSREAELVLVPGSKHGTGLLESRTDLVERIAAWMDDRLSKH